MRTVDQARREMLQSTTGPGLAASGPGLGPNGAFSLTEPLPLTNAYDRLSLTVASTVSLGNVLQDKNRAFYGESTSTGGLLGDDSSAGGSQQKVPPVINGHGLLEDHNTRGHGEVNTNGDTRKGTNSGSGGSVGGSGGSRDPSVGYQCCDVLASVEQVCMCVM